MTREQKGAAIFASGTVVLGNGEILVPSETSDAVYRVRIVGDRATCTCPDFQRRQRECKHVFAAAYLAADMRKIA